jgi:Lrp/AsnC family leucine-responsive transcriptional regulator
MYDCNFTIVKDIILGKLIPYVANMPFQLDDYDVHILKALLRDGRKSFRKISRETSITTPTVKARFNRLVNIGFIKSVSPILDFNVVEETIGRSELDTKAGVSITTEEPHKYDNQALQLQRQQLQTANSKIKKGIKIKLDCEFCHGPILGDPHVFKFATYERFFCCTACMSGYKKRYAGRIDSIRRRFEEKIPASAEF